MPPPQANPHVSNLMVDSFIANASPDDLRAAVRTMLSSTAPSTAGAFTRAARNRLAKVYPVHVPANCQLFASDGRGSGLVVPGADLPHVMRHARALYGAGLGLTALEVLAEVIRGTYGLRWIHDGDTADMLALVDADLCQAIQSAKEEIEAGRAGDPSSVHNTIAHVRAIVQRSEADIAMWSQDFPFERAAISLETWKV